MPDQIKAILFDADGVMIASSSIYAVLSQLVGIDENIIKSDIHEIVNSSLMGEVDLVDSLTPILASWKYSSSSNELISLWLEHIDQVNQDLIQHIRQIKSQKQIPIYLASNKEKYRARYLLETNSFNQLFAHSFFSYEMKSLKPGVKYWEYIWDSLEYLDDISDRSHVLLIDDDLDNIKAAKNFGFQAHHFQNNAECITLLNSL